MKCYNNNNDTNIDNYYCCNYKEYLKKLLFQYCYNLINFYNNYIKSVNYNKLIHTKMLYL